jgi:protein SCO1/2
MRAAAAVVGLAFALRALPAAAQAATPAPENPARDQRPAILRDVGIAQRLGASLPLDAVFKDEDGRAVRLGQYFRTSPVILVLAYYNCPMLCTEVLNGLVGSLKTLSFDVGKEFQVVTVSFDPAERPADASAKKKAYLDVYNRSGAGQGWHFLTGPLASIERITEAVGFRYARDERTGQFAHAAAIYVATPDGRLSRYFYGIDYAPRDLRLGLIEASDRKIGNPVDQLLLYCYHYDPSVGRYGAVVMNMLRVAGAAAVLILAAFVVGMLRRERRREAGRALREAGGQARSS